MFSIKTQLKCNVARLRFQTIVFDLCRRSSYCPGPDLHIRSFDWLWCLPGSGACLTLVLAWDQLSGDKQLLLQLDCPQLVKQKTAQLWSHRRCDKVCMVDNSQLTNRTTDYNDCHLIIKTTKVVNIQDVLIVVILLHTVSCFLSWKIPVSVPTWPIYLLHALLYSIDILQYCSKIVILTIILHVLGLSPLPYPT